MIVPAWIINATLILFCVLNLTGCWNYREIDDLAIVAGISFDQAKGDKDKVTVTAQIIKPSEIKSPGRGGSGGGGSAKKSYLNVSNTAYSCFDNFRRLTLVVNRKLFLSHSEVVIFGEKLAREGGIRGCVDLLLRDAEPRLTSWVVVAKGEAKEVFDTATELEQIPARNIAQLVNSYAATSEYAAVNLNRFFQRLMSKTSAPLASLVEVQGEGSEKIARLVGTAVFKKDKLAGYLTLTESRGLLWVLGEVKSGIIIAKAPHEKGEVSLEILRASSKITPGLKEGKPFFTVKIREEGNLGEQSVKENLTTMEAWAALERNQASVIRREIEAAVRKAQEMNADIFGFGEIFYRKHPALWKKMEPHWDEIFPEVEVHIVVEAKLRLSGMVLQTTAPRTAG